MIRYFRFGTAVFAAFLATFFALTLMSQAAPNDVTIVIKPSTMAAQSWSFLLEGVGTTSTGDFVIGPATPPAGIGSVHFTTPAVAERHYIEYKCVYGHTL
jgi:hypothetical protein